MRSSALPTELLGKEVFRWMLGWFGFIHYFALQNRPKTALKTVHPCAKNECLYTIGKSNSQIKKAAGGIWRLSPCGGANSR
jgi:hypothetical protein